MNMKTTLAAGLMTAMVSTAADAATFNFEYITLSGSVVTATVEGTVDAGDANLVNVASVIEATFGGISFGPMAYSAATFTAPNGTGVISFDGLQTEFLTCFTPICADGFIISVLDTYAFPTYDSGSSFGGGFQTYDPANASLTQLAPVPLPAAMPLLLVALGGLGFAARRRKTA